MTADAAPTYMLRYPGGTEQHEFVLAENYDAMKAERDAARERILGLTNELATANDGLNVWKTEAERLCKDAAWFRWMMADADRCASIVGDAYNGWDTDLSWEDAVKREIDDFIAACTTCGGTGEIDETLGGIATSNPHAPCPDCAGAKHGDV
jgi:hypothetical protein